VLICVAINAWFLGYTFGVIWSMMSKSISRSLSAIYVFLLTGMVIASFTKTDLMGIIVLKETLLVLHILVFFKGFRNNKTAYSIDRLSYG
jgi:hypothetical protein